VLASAFFLLVTLAGPPVVNTMTWTDNSGGTALTLVERKVCVRTCVGTERWLEIAQVPRGQPWYRDQYGLRTGLLYCYRARARVGLNYSPYSGEACKWVP
jgi:hypothetical protein